MGPTIYPIAAQNGSINVFWDPPGLVYIAGHKDADAVEVNCTLAACYFMFAATAKGLGTCWITPGIYIKSPSLLEELGLSEDDKIVAPLIVGYPKKKPKLIAVSLLRFSR